MNTKLTLALITLALFAGIHQTLAQNTVFTYQGRVTDNGTNFNGSGQFKFALVTSTNASHTATATATAPSGGFITGYVVTSGGSGYVTAPSVTISGGGGSGAAAAANISGGAVTSISVNNPGNGQYTTTPTVTIAPPPPNISYTTFWSNDQTSNDGSEPVAAVNVNVAGGLFTVTLGDTTIPNMAAIDSALFAQPDLQLRIWFNDGVNGFAALDPAQNLTATPYAIVAGNVNALSGFSVQPNTNGAPNLIGGSPDNFVASGVIGATIAGGGATNAPSSDIFPTSATNSVTADFGTVSGGAINTASGTFTTVGGGYANTASGEFATLGGGDDNTASGFSATVGGGGGNIASGDNATVGGGSDNTASTNYATVGGGGGNIASGDFATVPGGEGNLAKGRYSFAAGVKAQALHDGAFVWADSQGILYSSDRINQFKIRAGGGVQMDVSGSSGLNPAAVTINSTSGNGVGLVVNQSSSDTAALFANNGTGDLLKGFSGGGNTVFQVLNDGTVKSKNVTLTSDRNAKENFAPLDAQTILEKVAALPLTEWNYKTDDAGQKHIGPMAQDFHAAFDLNGADDKHISVVDEGGVALAAIQGLNEKLSEKDREITELKARLEKLERLMNNGGAK